MNRQTDEQYRQAIMIAKAEGADYVAILLARLQQAQKEIEFYEATLKTISDLADNWKKDDLRYQFLVIAKVSKTRVQK